MGNSVGLVSTPCGSSGARVLLRAPLLSYGGAVGRVAVAAATRCDRAIGPDEQPELSPATRLTAACIEHPEFDRPKVNRPAIVVYFLEADQFSCEAVARPPPPPVSETVMPLPPAPQPPEVKPLAPDRYKIQMTVNRETYDKLRQAQDLLRHSVPNGDPAAI